MDNKILVETVLYNAGVMEALTLRGLATSGEIDDTEIIEQEFFVPEYPADGRRDFTDVAIGSPYKYDGQVYKLWQNHNANGNPDWTPDKAVSLWDICHTKDPAKAKPYMKPEGARGLYQTGECMVWTDGTTQRSKIENNAYNPDEYPDGWEIV